MVGFAEWGYLGLFIASFLAATILPLGSEVVFTALIFGGLNAWNCVAVATVGNFLGGMTCYYLGRLGKLEWLEKYAGVKHESLEKFVAKVRKYGDWLAFFSFMPAIGDIIAIAAGFLRCRIWVVSIAMFLGKLLRYVALLYIYGYFFL